MCVRPPGAQGMSHGGEGNAVLAISQFSHNLSVSLNNTNTAKNLKLAQVEHACSLATTAAVQSRDFRNVGIRDSSGPMSVFGTRVFIRSFFGLAPSASVFPPLQSFLGAAHK